MKTLVTTPAAIAVASHPEKITGRNDQRALGTDSHLEIVTFQGIRKLPT